MVSFSQIFIAVISDEVPDRPGSHGKNNEGPFGTAEHYYKLAYEMMVRTSCIHSKIRKMKMTYDYTHHIMSNSFYFCL